MANSFYPGDPAELDSEVRALLAGIPPDARQSASIVLAPHAGYVHSGRVAAAAFKQLAPDFERVVILASNHAETPAFEGASVDRAARFEMPGFSVPVDTVAAEELLKGELFVDVPGAHESYVAEVQLPFVRAVARRPFRVLSLMFGNISQAQARAVAQRLAGLADGKTAFVFSIDLSHYHPEAVASKLDRSCLDALVNMDAAEVANCETDATQVLLVMTELAALRGQTPRLVAYANSAATSGDAESVVGYGAIAYDDRFVLAEQERAALLALAREAIQAKVRAGRELEPPAWLLERFPRFRVERGAFVTLTRRGVLRGCVGSLEARRPLAEDVAANAVLAAVDDPRFEAVSAEELPEIEVSISVLDALRPLMGFHGDGLLDQLGRSKPGLVLRYRGRISTFLPEVWTQLPVPAEFLAALCEKQGSPSQCWREPEAGFDTYEAQHFAE